MPLRQSSSLMIGIMATLLVATLTMGVVVSIVPPTISIGIVVGVAVFILSFASTRFALYILIFATLLSPEFGSRSTDGGGVTLRVDDFLLLLIGFSQLTRTAIYRQVGLFTWTPLNRYITYYMLACVFATGMGMLTGNVRFVTGFFFVLKYFEYFIVYFMLVNNLDSKEQAKRFLLAMFITAAIVSIVSAAQIPGGGRVVAPFEGKSGEPNTLGGYLLLMASIVGGLLLTDNAIQKFRYKLGLAFLLLLMTIPILFTLSRATWLAAFPVYICFWFIGNKKGLLSLIGLLAISASPFVIPDAVTERALYPLETQNTKWARQHQETFAGITFDTSSSARIQSWKAAFNDMTNHPLLGYGITGWRFIDAQYLRVLLETGLIGLSVFLLLLWNLLKNAQKIYKEAEDPFFKGVAMGFLVGTIGLMAHATMANTFIIVRIMEPYWLLAAIVMATPTLEALDKQEKAEQAETIASLDPAPAHQAIPGTSR
ncbi:MAG: O-antigen ligase family protein [bacterium]|nr:O-antigen ligase family protein [bacterium]